MQLQEQETFTIQGPQLEVLGQAESKLPAPARRAPTAALVLAVVALVSVFGIGGLKLKGKYDRVEAVYTTASNEYGDGIQTDLAAQADAAASLIRLAGRILGEDDPTVAAANAALEGWNTTDATPAAQYQANQSLYAAVGIPTPLPACRPTATSATSWTPCTRNSPPARLWWSGQPPTTTTRRPRNTTV